MRGNDGFSEWQHRPGMDKDEGKGYFSRVFLPDIGDVPKKQSVLLIDNRDGIQHGSPFDFTIELSNPFSTASSGIPEFDNVQSVVLKGVSFPKIVGEEYVLIDVDIFNDSSMFSSSSDRVGTRVFASMYFDSSALNAGDIKPKFGTEVYNDPIVCNPPIARLSKMRVRFRKHDGSIVTAADAANVTRASLVLQINTCLKTNY